ncbi:MAG TPA: tRNA uridine-5-carboxymethylaminomethyl(34) synthesis GTPase MnmE [Terriglobales bacterium]|nr:tRNA uridine-5-carboxymethylaminomethyl(34) synthesis GTPase MnmE [Terriglobales bacterium]
MYLDDTIVAIATPAGRGGIGVVRLSGPEARHIAAGMLRLRHAIAPGHALFGDLVDDAGERVDEVVVTYFAKPHSYTTDDVIEISAHGSPVVLRSIVERAIAAGARLAEPGEFTMRAYLNGRIDLTQAEAVRDLIESQTLFQAKVAAQQLGGALSHRLQPIKNDLIKLIALLEAGIDFAEDDVSVAPDEQIVHAMGKIRKPLEELAASFSFGKIVHEGITLAIVGRPNVGKSSLFNRLVERERAIVTPIPGTTRDTVSETVAIEGIPVKLVDTAGIRESSDVVESMGIERSRQAIADADVVLVVTEAAHADEGDAHLLEVTARRPRVVVANKADLVLGTKYSVPSSLVSGNGTQLRTSAVTGEGISELRAQIVATATGGAAHEAGYLTNTRHHGLVQDSLRALDAAEQAVRNKTPHEMLLLDLYSALRPLDAITGQTTPEDVLNLIFSTFCIGK